MTMHRFTFNNKEYEYFNHPYNTTRSNERCVEIPISLNFLLENKSDNFLEIGCVLPYYIDSTHEVIDLMDNHPKSKKEDATKISFFDKTILSISTVEHIGLTDYTIQVKEKDSAINVCRKIITESKKYFITWPLGYNKHLDVWGYQQNAYYISRNENEKHLWMQKDFINLSEIDKMYGTFCCANSIIVLTN